MTDTGVAGGQLRQPWAEPGSAGRELRPAGSARVRVRVVGCSPAWPNPGGVQSGYLVAQDSRRLLLDCGPGVLAKLRELEDWPRVEAIAITHFHLDHFGDLVPWVWALMFGPAATVDAPELWLPPDGRETLGYLGERLGRPEMFEQAFRVREYGDGSPFEAAGFQVLPLRVPHYDLLAFGFRVSSDGATLGYSGDSGPSDALAEIARDADLFLCEATLSEPSPEGGMRGHLAEIEAEQAFVASRAKRLLLTHRPAERALEPRFEQAHDGMELEL